MNETEAAVDYTYLEKKLLSIPSPEGVYDDYFTRVIEPDDILLEIDLLQEEKPDEALQRRELFNYRFYEKREGGSSFLIDRFLAFWVTAQYYDKSTGKSKFRLKIANRKLSEYVDNAVLMSIFSEQINERMLYEQLYCSARRFLNTCRTDKTYKSVIFGVATLKDQQLKAKILFDYSDIVSFCWRCGLIGKYSVIGKAAVHAWFREYPDTEKAFVIN